MSFELSGDVRLLGVVLAVAILFHAIIRGIAVQDIGNLAIDSRLQLIQAFRDVTDSVPVAMRPGDERRRVLVGFPFNGQRTSGEFRGGVSQDFAGVFHRVLTLVVVSAACCMAFAVPFVCVGFRLCFDTSDTSKSFLRLPC